MFSLHPIIIAFVVPFISCYEFHYLTPEELNDIINNATDAVSNYDVVPVAHTLHKRDTSPTLRIKAFQEDIKLFLEPNDNILFGENTPIYLSYKSKTNASELTYNRLEYKVDFQMYHDLANKAALVIQKSRSGQIRVHGMINDLIIRPIPENMNYEARKKRSVSTEDPLVVEQNEIYTNDHIIVKVKINIEIHRPNRTSSNNCSNTLNNPAPGDNNSNQNGNVININIDSNIGNGNSKKERVYPEILVTTDYKTFRAFNEDMDEYLKHMAVLWNGVDLMFRTVENPEIRLNLAGFVIPQEEGADFYTKNHSFNNKILFDSEALKEFGDQLKKNTYISRKTYDVAVAVTHYDLTEKTKSGLSNTVLGISYFAMACQSIPVAIIEDNSVYRGILTAAHELGHLFGASHDGEKDSYIPGIPTAVNCSFQDGYVMSYINKDEKAHRWSKCSLDSMKAFLESDRAKCLRNKPVVQNPYHKFLPGMVTTLDEQCNANFPGSKHCGFFDDHSVCNIIFCTRPGSTNCYSAGAALDGSKCEKGICLIGQCVPVPKNFMNYY